MKARLLLVILVLAAALLGCKIDWEKVDPLQGVATAQAGYATQQYGAEQFHIQLTALATEQP